MSQHPPSPPADPPPARSRGVLANPAFRRIWAAGAITAMVRWLDMLVLSLYAYELTGEVGAVAVAFLIRMAPRLLFGFFVGAIADRMDRRRLWIAALAALCVMYIALAALVALHEIAFWHLLLFIFFAGIVWSIEFPTRRAMIADVVRPNQVGRAVGLDWSTDSILRIPGPLIGAGFLQAFGAEWAYGFAAVIFAAAALIASTLSYRPARVAHTEGQSLGAVIADTMRDIAAGLIYVRRRGLLLGTLVVTLVFNLLFPAYNAALPEIGQQILAVDQFRIGVLEALVGLGSFLGGLLIAGWGSWAQSGRIYYAGTAWFMLCVTGIVLSDIYLVSAALAFLMGFGFAAFAIMQTSILVTATPPAMRGRVMGVLSTVIGLGPLTGMQVLLLTPALGLQGMVLTVVLEGVALMLLALLFWPRIVKRLPVDDPLLAAAPAPQHSA